MAAPAMSAPSAGAAGAQKAAAGAATAGAAAAGAATAGAAAAGAAAAPHRKALVELRRLAMEAALDDGSYSRAPPPGTGEGWQLLFKLTDHVRSRLSKISSDKKSVGAAGAAVLGTPESTRTISQALDELKSRDELLRRQVASPSSSAAATRAAAPPTADDALVAAAASDSSVADALAALASRLSPAEYGAGAEQQAIEARELLDGPTSDGAAQLLKQAGDQRLAEGGGAAAGVSVHGGTGNGNGARRGYKAPRRRLACAREVLIQQAAQLRAAAGGTSGSGGGVGLLPARLLRAASVACGRGEGASRGRLQTVLATPAASVRAWEAASGVHASLTSQLETAAPPAALGALGDGIDSRGSPPPSSARGWMRRPPPSPMGRSRRARPPRPPQPTRAPRCGRALGACHGCSTCSTCCRSARSRPWWRRQRRCRRRRQRRRRHGGCQCGRGRDRDDCSARPRRPP